MHRPLGAVGLTVPMCQNVCHAVPWCCPCGILGTCTRSGDVWPCLVLALVWDPPELQAWGMADSVLQGQGWGRGSPWRLPGSWRGRGRGKTLRCVQAVGEWGGGGHCTPAHVPYAQPCAIAQPYAITTPEPTAPGCVPHPQPAALLPSSVPWSASRTLHLYPAPPACTHIPHPPSPRCILHPQLAPHGPQSCALVPILHPQLASCTPSFPSPPLTLQTAPRRGGSPQHPLPTPTDPHPMHRAPRPRGSLQPRQQLGPPLPPQQPRAAGGQGDGRNVPGSEFVFLEAGPCPPGSPPPRRLGTSCGWKALETNCSAGAKGNSSLSHG